MSLISPARVNAAFVPNRIMAHLPFISGISIDLDCNEGETGKIIKTYIRNRFSERYAASVVDFLPRFFTLSCNDNLNGVIGVRAAETGPLFLEKFLGNPVEQEMGLHFKSTVHREHIVEIGNLVSSRRGSSRLVFTLLVDFLHRINREWAVCTATREIIYLMKKSNINIITLFTASIDMPGEYQEQRRAYYQDKVKVVFFHLPGSVALLKQNILTGSCLSLFSDRLAELTERWKTESDK